METKLINDYGTAYGTVLSFDTYAEAIAYEQKHYGAEGFPKSQDLYDQIQVIVKETGWFGCWSGAPKPEPEGQYVVACYQGDTYYRFVPTDSSIVFTDKELKRFQTELEAQEYVKEVEDVIFSEFWQDWEPMD